VAIVNGAGRGIGRGEELLIAEEGAAVVVNDYGGSAGGEGGDKGPADDADHNPAICANARSSRGMSGPAGW
jgi:hypothetical protein